MKLDQMMLAEYAIARDGLLDVLRGGINRVTADSYPVQFTASLALSFVLDSESELGSHLVAIEFRRKRGRTAVAGASGQFEVSALGDLRPDEKRRVALALDLRPFAIPEPGEYILHVRVDDKTMGTRNVTALKGGGSASGNPTA
jgi:hypothetical protein